MKSGRCPELSALDIVEVRWWDTASKSHWDGAPATPVEVITVGYYNGLVDGSHGEYISMYPNRTEHHDVNDSIAIPRTAVIEVRRVSKGVD